MRSLHLRCPESPDKNWRQASGGHVHHGPAVFSTFHRDFFSKKILSVILNLIIINHTHREPSAVCPHFPASASRQPALLPTNEFPSLHPESICFFYFFQSVHARICDSLVALWLFSPRSPPCDIKLSSLWRHNASPLLVPPSAVNWSTFATDPRKHLLPPHVQRIRFFWRARSVDAQRVGHAASSAAWSTGICTSGQVIQLHMSSLSQFCCTPRFSTFFP